MESAARSKEQLALNSLRWIHYRDVIREGTQSLLQLTDELLNAVAGRFLRDGNTNYSAIYSSTQSAQQGANQEKFRTDSLISNVNRQ